MGTNVGGVGIELAGVTLAPMGASVEDFKTEETGAPAIKTGLVVLAITTGTVVVRIGDPPPLRRRTGIVLATIGLIGDVPDIRTGFTLPENGFIDRGPAAMGLALAVGLALPPIGFVDLGPAGTGFALVLGF